DARSQCGPDLHRPPRRPRAARRVHAKRIRSHRPLALHSNPEDCAMTSTTSLSSNRFRPIRSALGLAAGLALAAAITPAAADTPWFPMKVYDASSGTPKPAEYAPLAKAEKPYKLCVLFPHMKDSFWVAVAYGIVKQAEAMNVNMNLFEAGGYENLPKTLSQFDDCMAVG